MARRRCLSLDVIDTDQFLELPLSTQALYMHLVCRADDDGFIGNPKKITKMLGANEIELQLLCKVGLLIPFDSGVVVVTDWRTQNTLQNDRYKPTRFLSEKSLLELNENKQWELFNKDFNKILGENTKN